jgi:A/G-specific adenine glycosylase
MDKKKIFAQRIILWHHDYKANFPWRQTCDPYRILISELLLRKTTRTQVSRVFDLFFREYPTPQALATSSEHSIEKVIKPLGMEHNRAPALKKLAQVLLLDYNGRVPTDKDRLMKLPNVGLYTANAVRIFAFGFHEPLLDTNIFRVASRVFSFKSDKERPRNDPKIWAKIEELLPAGKAKEFHWAILDFANSICLLKKPKCSTCFLLDICDYGRISPSRTISNR